MDMDRYIGRMLDDRYEILEVIGTGGMAVVYKALCHRLNRLVALKVLKDENLQDEDFRRRFHAEGQAVAMLSHPNIVSVYDVSTAGDADYIVMELIDGITLKQYMERKGVLNWKETLHFAIQIAKALEHAHSRGLVHRDIKPHNVMVLKNGSVKVADFGIAQVMTQSDTLTKEALGSVHYISPEQAKGGRVDHRSDIYSLGVVMYEMIAGRPPFDGDTPVSVAIQHINGGAEKPSTFNPNIPEGLEQIILRSMSHDMAQRYATATVMPYDMDELRKDPAALFTYQKAERITGNLNLEPADGTAEEAALSDHSLQQTGDQQQTDKDGGASKEKRKRKSRRGEQEEEERSRVAVVAIVACSVVALLAILVCMVLLMDVPEPVRRVQVPGVVGRYFDQLPSYDGLVIVEQSREYSTQYEKGQIIRQEPEGGTYHDEGTVVFVVVSLGEEPPASTMVDMLGWDAEEARQYLTDLNIGLYILPREEHSDKYGTGLITRTKPADGEPLHKGETVILWVSIGPKVVKAKMPNLLSGSGMQMETARLILNNNGFKNLEWVPVDHMAPYGTVLSQSVAANIEVDVTTLIVLEYSTGNAPSTSNPTDPTGHLTEPTELSTVTKIFVLPDRAEEYTLRIELDGVVVQPDTQIAPGTTQWVAALTGSGVQTCTVFINGEIYETVDVNFEADE